MVFQSSDCSFSNMKKSPLPKKEKTEMVSKDFEKVFIHEGSMGYYEQKQLKR